MLVKTHRFVLLEKILKIAQCSWKLKKNRRKNTKQISHSSRIFRIIEGKIRISWTFHRISLNFVLSICHQTCHHLPSHNWWNVYSWNVTNSCHTRRHFACIYHFISIVIKRYGNRPNFARISRILANIFVWNAGFASLENSWPLRCFEESTYFSSFLKIRVQKMV